MAENKDLLDQGGLSIKGIANASIAYATFGMTTDDNKEVWDAVRRGTTRQLLTDKTPITTTQPIEMILGTLTIVDGTSTAERQSDELRDTNSELVNAILSRQDELLKMPLSVISTLFACLSRFIAMMDQGQETPSACEDNFNQYKENFAGMLAGSHELKVDDVFVLATPLAAE